MTDPAQWRLPEEALFFDHEVNCWKVMPLRGLGESRAIFIPLVQQGGSWEVDVPIQQRIDLTKAPEGTWTPLRRIGGSDGCRYLCVIRYDVPSNHPDDSFSIHSVGSPPPADVSGQDLRRVFQQILSRSPVRIKRDAVSGPPDPLPFPQTPAPAPLPAGRAQVRSAAQAYATPAPAPAPVADLSQLPQKLTFAFGSCQYPAGMLDRLVAGTTYQSLADHLAGTDHPPERLLLLGDQVYVDATYGLLDPSRLDDQYRMPYEDLRDRDTGPLSVLPMNFLARIRTTPDDHEFLDDWEPWRPSVKSQRFDTGLEAFWEHQRRIPGVTTPRGVEHEERHPGWRLFMVDTRTERQYRAVETLSDASIMSGRQETHLKEFLTSAPPHDLKVITSPAMLLPRSREYAEEPVYLDNWQGYPASFRRLLAFLCDNEVQNVVFLSGDAHIAVNARVVVRNLETRKRVEFASLHAPAFYAPYPFANESRFNLLLHDRFVFPPKEEAPTEQYECTVCADIVDEGYDGCGLLVVTRTGGTWKPDLKVLRPPPTPRKS